MNYEVIEHHGVLGQKWGIRRYQNADGSLTRAGKKHIQQIQKNMLEHVIYGGKHKSFQVYQVEKKNMSMKN